MSATRPIAAAWRLAILSRLAAAVAGGYGLAVMVAIAFSWALPLAREEAATAATLAGIVAMPAAAMGCFWARSATRAWIGIAAGTAACAGIALAAGWRP